MFLYPEQSLVERILPKNKIYGNAQPNRAMRQRFVNEVDQIVWRYKLAPETSICRPRPALKRSRFSRSPSKQASCGKTCSARLTARFRRFIFFELTFQGKVRFCATYKRVSEADSKQLVVDAYFQTPWQDAAAPRRPLPVALDLGSLYEQMLRQHMQASPLALRARTGETLAETIERANRIRAKRRERQRLEVRLKREIQFNRKVEINAALRQCCTELADLEGTGEPGLAI